MNIAIIGTRGVPANYGGFETCVEHVSKFWAESNHDVLVYCRKNHYENKLKTYNGCTLRYITSFKTKSLDTLTHTFFCCLDVIFKRKKYDHVHLYNCGNSIFLPLLKLFGKKVIVSVDGIEWKRAKWGTIAKTVHKIGERLSVMFADEIITDNTVVENYYFLKYKRKPVTIPYGAKIPVNDATLETATLSKYNLTKNNYFIFVGRIVPEKGVHNLIEAYNKLSTDTPLVIIGDGDKDSDYRNELFKQDSNKIRFLGYIYGSEYEQLLKNALIYVSASELEGTSPSLLAAMGAKVCTLINGIDENLCTVEDSGYCYKVNDTSDLVRIWKSLLKNPLMLQSMSEKGYSLINRKYKWGKIASDYIAVLNSIN